MPKAPVSRASGPGGGSGGPPTGDSVSDEKRVFIVAFAQVFMTLLVFFVYLVMGEILEADFYTAFAKKVLAISVIFSVGSMVVCFAPTMLRHVIPWRPSRKQIGVSLWVILFIDIVILSAIVRLTGGATGSLFLPLYLLIPTCAMMMLEKKGRIWLVLCLLFGSYVWNMGVDNPVSPETRALGSYRTCEAVVLWACVILTALIDYLRSRPIGATYTRGTE